VYHLSSVYMSLNIKYGFSSKVWRHPAPEGWYFVSLPRAISKEIREQFKFQEQGWGRLKVSAQTGMSTWTTSVWFDTKRQTYLLPVKAEIRIKEKINEGSSMKITIRI